MIGNSETWIDHFARLEKLKTSGYASDETYDIVYRVVNAADYGVPQCRERVFIVGFRHDQQIEWSFPKPTNSYEALLYSQYISGEYCQRHNIVRNDLPTLSGNIRKKLETLESETPVLKPWKTVRDALRGLPPPTTKGDCKFANHKFQSGAKVYPGHTGSCIDLPAKTIKAGAHGVPGGENMLILPSGKPRYFTVRESARLQTFPDDYVFTGSSWCESMRQIGNAVPVRLAKAISSSVVIQLLATQAEALRTPKLIFRS